MNINKRNLSSFGARIVIVVYIFDGLFHGVLSSKANNTTTTFENQTNILQTNAGRNSYFDFDEKCYRQCLNSEGLVNSTTNDFDLEDSLPFGIPVQQDEFPSSVMLTYKDKFICGGSIINSKFILTAAHCLKYKTKVRQRQLLKVIAGVTVQGQENFSQYRTVNNFIFHEHFRDSEGYYLENDIAIVEVKTPLKFNQHVAAIILPNQNEDVKGNLTVIGWGLSNSTSSNITSESLSKVTLSIVAKNNCQAKYEKKGIKLTDNMFCAGESGKLVCKGDRGSQAMCKEGNYLCGIVSWKVSCNETDIPGVYVKVSNYVDWIHSKIKIVSTELKTEKCISSPIATKLPTPGKNKNQIIRRQALGRMASLGDLYDAHLDEFTGISVFRKEPPKSVITIVDAPDSNIRLSYSKSFRNKFHLLDVQASLAATVITKRGTFTLSGAAEYLKDYKTSSKTLEGSLLYNIGTAYEKLNIFHDDIRDIYGNLSLVSQIGTHIVSGISWGCNAIASCTHEMAANENQKEIKGNLSIALDAMAVNISGQGAVNYNDLNNSSDTKFDVRIYGDILPPNGSLPLSFPAALVLMSKFPELVKQYNGGKGKPLYYHLVPVTTVAEFLNIPIKENIIVRQIESDILDGIVQFFDDVLDAKLELNDFHQSVIENRHLLTIEELKLISEYMNNVTLIESKLSSNLSSVLTQVRKGNLNSSEISELIKEAAKGDKPPYNIYNKLNEWKYIKERISFANAFEDKGITYIGWDSSVEQHLGLYNKTFVLYYWEDKIGKHDPASVWEKNEELFLSEAKKSRSQNFTNNVDDESENIKFLVFNCNLTESTANFYYECRFPANLSSIIKVFNGTNLAIEDYYAYSKHSFTRADFPYFAWIPREDMDSFAAIYSNLDPILSEGGNDGWNCTESICRASLFDSRIQKSETIPGKLYRPLSCGKGNKDPNYHCKLAYQGKEVEAPDFEVLSIPYKGFEWVPCTGSCLDGKIENVIKAGGDFICKNVNGDKRIKGKITIGRFTPGQRSCSIPFDRKAYDFDQFEILVRN